MRSTIDHIQVNDTTTPRRSHIICLSTIVLWMKFVKLTVLQPLTSDMEALARRQFTDPKAATRSICQAFPIFS